jgi:hypothetical protein
MFTSSARFAFADYLRVPVEVDPTLNLELPEHVGALQAIASPHGRKLLWARAEGGRHAPGTRTGHHKLVDIDLVCPVFTGTPEEIGCRRWTRDEGWRPLAPVLNLQGSAVAQVWIDDHGSVFLPFDPGEAMVWLWSERYTTLRGVRLRNRLRHLLVDVYYGIRPLLPRSLQLRLRRGYAARQRYADFPSWPEEHALHDLYAWLLDLLQTIAEEPVPYLHPWPNGHTSAFVLTHDVETSAGRDSIEALRAPERARGLRSAWNLVPERYPVAEELLDGLRSEGCEIGVHGLRHDGRDLASKRMLRKRLPAIREWADRWGAVGFRSPATQRSWDLMPQLGFDYDSSYTDSAPHEPQPGGCCTYLPFFIDDLVELPLTLPQDHTLFDILGLTDGAVWKAKVEAVRSRGGMVLMIAHPDYVDCPGMLRAWEDLLDQLGADPQAWHALPREVAAWWRRRAQTLPELEDGVWVARGPAAGEAVVAWSSPPNAHGRTEALVTDGPSTAHE